MKVGYIGNFFRIPEYMMHSGYELASVIVEEERLSDELFTFLKVRNIPYTEVKNSDELVNEISRLGITTWVTCSYGKRIPIEKMNNVEIYNIHYAALPNYKGRHPTFYATMANELSVGITLHKVTPHLDEGAIISQRKVPYYIWEDENILTTKMTEEVPQLLADLFEYLRTGKVDTQISNSEGFYYSPVVVNDYTIDIENDSPTTMYNKVRAQAKYNGALIKWDGIEYWVHKIYFSTKPEKNALCILKDGYYIIMQVTPK